MIRNIAVLITLLALIGGYTWYDNRAQQTPQAIMKSAPVTINQAAPDFAFLTLDGKQHRLLDFKGKVIVLNFWATWCAPCVVEFPQMVKLAEATQNRTVFIFLSQDEDIKAVQNFLKKHGAALPQENVLIAIDKNQQTAQSLYQTYKLPETYLIDPDLMIREKVIGNSVMWNSPEIQQKLSRL